MVFTYLCQSVYHIESIELFDANHDYSLAAVIYLIIYCSTFNLFYLILIENKCLYFLVIVNGMKNC